MTTCWQELALSPTSDRHAIRAAYAARLKDVRPDVDPAGFQRLRESRDLALSLAAHAGGAPDAAPQSRSGDAQTGAIIPGPQSPLAVESAQAQEPDEFTVEVGRLTSPWGNIWDYDAWWTMLNRLVHLPIDRGRALEQQIIKAVADEQRLRPSANDTPEHRWRRDEVLLLLGDEFGWSRDDGILYETLPRAAADRLAQMIRRAEERLAKRDAMPAYDAASAARPTTAPTAHDDPLSAPPTGYREHVPVLSEFDFNAFFATHDDRPLMRAYYDKALATSEWPVVYYAPAGMRGFLWTASYGMWKHTAMLFVFLLALIALIVTYNLNLLPLDFLGIFAHRAVWLTGIFLALFALGLASGMGREWLIKHAAKWAAYADGQRLKPSIARFEMLQAAGTQRRGWLTAYKVLFWLVIAIWLIGRNALGSF